MSRRIRRFPRAGLPLLSLLLVVAPAFGQAKAPDPRTVVARAVQAMGGEAALRGLRSTSVDFNSASFALGQEETPASPPRAAVASGKIVTDWQAGRRVTTGEVRLVTGAVNRQRRVIRDGMGMTETNNQASMDASAAVDAAERAMRLQPERYLLTALDHPEGLSPLTPRPWRGETMEGVRYAIGPDTMSLYFDRGTGLVVVAVAVTDDPILGDRRTATWYTRWQESGGLKLPRQVDTEVNGRLLSHNVVTAATVNGELDTALFAISDSMVARAPARVTTPPPVTVQLVELGPGVWRAEGGSHHSLVVEQPDRLVVIEAPQSTQRTQAVLDTLRSRFPAKRVRLVVNTHHHWDHAGGLRAALAAGIPIVTHRRNVEFVRGISSAAKTVTPDALSRTPRAPVIRAVSDSLTLGSGESRVVIYAIPTVHAEGVLAAWVPSARILFASDVLSPGANAPPARAGSGEVVALARARGLSVDRFAGGHGVIANWADVEQAAGR